MKNNLKKLQSDFWEIVQYDTQGKRSAMEDYSHFMVPFTSSETSLLLSVYDGHAGHRCAEFLAHSLPAELRKETLNSNSSLGGGSVLPSEEGIKKIFKALDQMWLDSAAKKEPKIEDGSTALCVALDCSDLLIANCGDCRAILSQGGQTVALTRDHKPTDEVEHQRIVNYGGTVFGGRLQGKLAVSRAFGNYEFKELQILSSEPEIQHVSLSPDVEYLVVGSDGLYEHFTNEEIISFLKNGLIRKNLESVVKELVEEAIDRGAEDNITILVVKFEKGFKKLLKKRAKKQTGKSTAGSVLPGPAKSIIKVNHCKNSSSTTSSTSSAAVTSATDFPPRAPTLTKKKTNPKKFLTPKTGTGHPSGGGRGGYKSFSPRRVEKPFVNFKYDFFGSRTPVIISG